MAEAEHDAPIPWRDLMRHGFGVMHLSSEQFWALTLHEVAAAMDFGLSSPNKALPSRTLINELMQAHPDNRK